MQDFLLVFRRGANALPTDSPEQMQAMTGKWMDWIGGIAAQHKLVDRGNRLAEEGRVVKGGIVTDGPFTELKELVGGYTIIRAESYDDAAEIAKGCPVLQIGGSVEIRGINPVG